MGTATSAARQLTVWRACAGSLTIALRSAAIKSRPSSTPSSLPYPLDADPVFTKKRVEAVDGLDGMDGQSPCGRRPNRPAPASPRMGVTTRRTRMYRLFRDAPNFLPILSMRGGRGARGGHGGGGRRVVGVREGSSARLSATSRYRAPTSLRDAAPAPLHARRYSSGSTKSSTTFTSRSSLGLKRLTVMLAAPPRPKDCDSDLGDDDAVAANRHEITGLVVGHEGRGVPHRAVWTRHCSIVRLGPNAPSGSRRCCPCRWFRSARLGCLRNGMFSETDFHRR